jgi:hypothetical protein
MTAESLIRLGYGTVPLRTIIESCDYGACPLHRVDRARLVLLALEHNVFSKLECGYPMLVWGWPCQPVPLVYLQEPDYRLVDNHNHTAS